MDKPTRCKICKKRIGLGAGETKIRAIRTGANRAIHRHAEARMPYSQGRLEAPLP